MRPFAAALPLFVVFTTLSTGCQPDDVKGEDSGGAADGTDGTDGADGTDGTDGGGADPAAIQGTWLSEGDNVAPLLADFGFTSLTATFGADGSYAVEAVYNGNPIPLTGTYTVDVSTTPHTIVVNQESPQAVTSAGIWQVEGDTLTYEIVQTSPDQGFTAPTPDSGFGSTAGAGVEPNSNIQVYVRQ
jgi:hypothetical protein